MRPRTAVLYLACLTAMLLSTLPPAAAQSQEDFVDIEVSLQPVDARVERGASVDIIVVVHNPTQNPAPGDVTLQATGFGPGWNGRIREESFTLAGGATREVRLTITAPDDTDHLRTGYTVTATIRYALLPDVPLQASATKTVTGTVAIDLNAYDALDHRLGGWLTYGIIGLATLAVAVGAILYLRRRGVVLEADQAEYEIGSRPTTFLVHVQNLSPRADDIDLAASDLPPGWSVRFEPERVSLAARGRADVKVHVQAGKKASGRAHLTIAAVTERDEETTLLEIVLLRQA